MKQQKLAKILSVVLLCTFIFGFIFITQMGAIDRILIGCDGIESFYNGDDFYNDHSDMMTKFLNLPNARPTITLASPRQILDGYPFDCNSISNAVHCLAEEYDMPCRFVITAKWSSDIIMRPGHIGIECYDNDFDDWVTLY